MRRKLFTIALSAIMVIAMAVPALAAPPTGNRVWIYNSENIYPNLNAATNGIPGNNTNVTMWSNTGSDSQRWNLIQISATNKTYYIRNQMNTTVALNIYRNGTDNCTLTTIAGSSTPQDMTIKCVDETGGYYGLVIPAYVKVLTPTGFADGSNVNWQNPNGSARQLWRISETKY